MRHGLHRTVLLALAVAVTMASECMGAAVVTQFSAPVMPSPDNHVEGLAYGGGSLWFSNALNVVQIDPVTGSPVTGFAVTGYVNDLTWAAGELWGARQTPPELVRYDPVSGAELATISTLAQGIPEGLAFDGSLLLFSVDGPPAMVYTANRATSTVGPGRPSVVTDTEGLAYGEGFIWEGGAGDAMIHKVQHATGIEIASSSGPASDIHGLAHDGSYLWVASASTEVIYQMDVSDVNAPPTLTYLGTPGYETDGVDPDSGNSSTPFNFQVVFTDLDDDWPWWVFLHIMRDGVEISGSPFYMAWMGDWSFDDGSIFTYTRTLPEGSNYSYAFSAATWEHDAGGEATVAQPGPFVSNLPPVLDWTGEPGYESDGVDPDIGQPVSTDFRFRVLYTNALPADYVRLHILKKGVPITNSPFDMATTDTSPHNGAIYTFQRKLTRSRAYTYHFEASNGTQMAGGAPVTTPSAGPVVGNKTPTLAWTGEPGFVGRGVSPATGTDREEYAFRVLYTDGDNDWPDGVRLHVARGASEVDGSPFTMRRVPGTKPRSGVIYRTSTHLRRGKAYTYWFETTDGYAPATGPPTTPNAGPVVNSPPMLEWASYGPFRRDGVRPDRSVGWTLCQFRVRYRDLDNDPATSITVEIRKDGTPLPNSPFTMALTKPRRPRRGQVWKRDIGLGPGTYSYRFAANDGFADALGVPTRWKKGPVIKGGTAAQVASLCTVPTRTGTQITFSLSAPASVDAQVLNIAGRPVKALAVAKDCADGLNTLAWDGRDRTGLAAPSGTYIVTVTARNGAGVESRAVAQVMLRR